MAVGNKKKKSLISRGRGLEALLAKQNVARTPMGAEITRLEEIRPDPDQARKHFDDESLQGLAESIKKHGLLQPLLVTPTSGKDDVRYMIVAGERRYRACCIAGLNEIPVRVINGDGEMLSEISLIENIQREDLTPLETARGIKALMESHHLTQQEAADRIGWKRSAVANKVRLLSLPSKVKEYVDSKVLSEGHAKVLLGVKEKNILQELADHCVAEGWSIRVLSQKLDEISDKRKKTAAAGMRKWHHADEKVISESLGIKLSFMRSGQKNKVILSGLSESQVEHLVAMLKGCKS